MSDILGYCVVTFNQASGQAEFDLPDLHQDREPARWELEAKEAETARNGRGETHMIAVLYESDGDDE